MDLLDPAPGHVNLALHSIRILFDNIEHLVLNRQFFVDHDTHVLQPSDRLAEREDVFVLFLHNLLLQLEYASILQLTGSLGLFERSAQHATTRLRRPGPPPELLSFIRRRRRPSVGTARVSRGFRGQAFENALESLDFLLRRADQIFPSPDLAVSQLLVASPSGFVSPARVLDAFQPFFELGDRGRGSD